MARYIDADAAAELARLTYCKDCNSYNGIRCGSCEFDDAMSFIDDFPEADVVPRTDFADQQARTAMFVEVIARQGKEIERLECQIGMLNEITNSYALQYGTAIDKEIILKGVKTEVAREIFAEIDNMFIDFISLFHDNISKATIEQNKDKQQVNSVALSVIDTARKCLAELKKKYLGEQKGGE